jgi:hypothetical protein
VTELIRPGRKCRPEPPAQKGEASKEEEARAPQVQDTQSSCVGWEGADWVAANSTRGATRRIRREALPLVCPVGLQIRFEPTFFFHGPAGAKYARSRAHLRTEKKRLPSRARGCATWLVKGERAPGEEYNRFAESGMLLSTHTRGGSNRNCTSLELSPRIGRIRLVLGEDIARARVPVRVRSRARAPRDIRECRPCRFRARGCDGQSHLSPRGKRRRDRGFPPPSRNAWAPWLLVDLAALAIQGLLLGLSLGLSLGLGLRLGVGLVDALCHHILGFGGPPLGFRPSRCR